MDRTALAIFTTFATSSLVAFFCYVWMSSAQVRINLSEAPATEIQQTIR